jgi:hypothetical protein
MPDFELADSDARPIDPIVPKFREWVILRAQVTEMTTRMNRLRDTVSQAVENRGYADHKGSQYIDLPFARKKGCYDRAFPPVRHLDVDELYVLYQEDVLSQDELDEILTPRETFAFKGMA